MGGAMGQGGRGMYYAYCASMVIAQSIYPSFRLENATAYLYLSAEHHSCEAAARATAAYQK
eukprot:183363-Pleurochrysis_carterae.AAC.1